jgi:broad specificity phosphatase PhoE
VYYRQYGSYSEMSAVRSFLARVQQEMAFLLAEAEMRAIMAITHGGFIRTALTELYGFPELEAHRHSAQYASILTLPPFSMEAR